MENEIYKETIKSVSKQIAEKILNNEKGLAQRATSIDSDIAGILREVGAETTKEVLETVKKEIIISKKKSTRD